jgi:hypothetical protein
MSRADELMEVLKGLKDGHDEIRACMVARRGLEGLIMFPQSFKDEVATIWGPLSVNINDMLLMIDRQSGVGLNRMYTEVLGLGVFFLVIGASDTALIAFVRGENPLKDAAKIMDDLEAARAKISGG